MLRVPIMMCTQSTVVRCMADTQPAQADAKQNRSITVRSFTR